MVLLVNDALPGEEYETNDRHAAVLASSGWYPKPADPTPPAGRGRRKAAGADGAEATNVAPGATPSKGVTDAP